MNRTNIFKILFLGIAIQTTICLLTGILIDHRNISNNTDPIILTSKHQNTGLQIRFWDSTFATRADFGYDFSRSPGFRLDGLVENLFTRAFKKPKTAVSISVSTPHQQFLIKLEEHLSQKQARGPTLIATTYVSHGFPFRATYGTVEVDFTKSLIYQPQQKTYLLNPSDGRSAPLKIICWGIHWPGFIANSLICSLILGLISFTFTNIKHKSRIRRNHCPKCNYDLCAHTQTHNPTCPECGHTHL